MDADIDVVGGGGATKALAEDEEDAARMAEARALADTMRTMISCVGDLLCNV